MVIRWAQRRLWLAWLVLGATATAGYFALPVGVARDVAYDVIGAASAVMIVVGVRHYRPERPSLWYWFTAGTLSWVVGDLVYDYYQYSLHRQPYPSVADIFYLAAYPMLVAALLGVIRGRGRDLAALLDACIIATGLTLLLWAVVMRPIAVDASASLLTRVTGLAYPVGDVLILAVLVRLVTGAGARALSLWFLITSMALLLASDLGYAMLITFSSYSGGAIDAGWLLSYVVTAAAALYPSMRRVSQPQTYRPERLTRRRLTLLAGCSVLAPALLILEDANEPGRLDWFIAGTIGMLPFLLVILRMAGLNRTVQEQANRLRAQATMDDLTGLPNWRLLEQLVGDALPGRLQVAFIDLDEFKAINDRLGHAVGDRVVVAVGRRLTEAVRHTDTVARLGGDEFAILMPDTPDDAADEIIARLTGTLEHPVTAGAHTLLVQASIGLANAAGTADAGEVLRRADVAMYAAKEAGGNRSVRFRPEMDENAREHARLGAALRRALDQDEFELWYQPIVALPAGRVTGVEALLRWRSPRFGLINPLEFIPVAERNGLIVPIGTWVLREACSRAVTWKRTLGTAAPGTMSVNASARQLAEPDFPELVAAVLAETGMRAADLVIEVTETTAFGGGRALDALRALDELGVGIALDDFGTGHSSLGLLQTCPVDILKVDKSFVDGITAPGRPAAIATALISLSRGLGLAAIAEGVETAEQAAALHRLGYQYAQGYHFYRPMPAAELADGLRLGEPAA